MKKVIIYCVNKLLWLQSYLLRNIIKDRITVKEMKDLLSKYSGKVYLSDIHYATTDIGLMKSLIKLSPLKYKKFEDVSFDCDDYSLVFAGMSRFMLKGFAVGILWTDKHAQNFFVDMYRDVWLIEPQNNEVTLMSKRMNTQFMLI